MNKDTVAGSIKKAGGEARESIANVTGDKKAQVLGKQDQVEGEAQNQYGQVKDAVKKADHK